MALTQYKKKRSFGDTPEPTGGKTLKTSLRFVVQKHDVSHLHYDFRLEMGGVLKSWAVPKGPSLNPEDKRLAMMVEDHPYDYRNFEGIIPEGNYGAGTVIVWDEGTYESLEPGDKKFQEKLLLKQLAAGSLKVRLEGTKLKGEFALVKLKGKQDNAWLLIKHRDKFAKQSDITKKDKSVVSGKTLAGVERSSHSTAKSKKAEKSPKTKTAAATKTAATTKTGPARKKKGPDATLTAGRKSAFPKTVSPMLATLVDRPFDEQGWTYEIKWDGYRAVALINNGKVSLLSRNNKTFNEKFYPIREVLEKWDGSAVLDGEIVVLNDKGIANFGSLQNWRSEADGELIYYVFDLLWLNGRDLKELPLVERRRLLAQLFPLGDNIRMSESFDTSATKFLATVTKMGMEGIMAKKERSIYIEGDRSREWLKIKANKRHEVVIGGYTQNEGSPKSFSALLVGVYNDNGKLEYIGKIGTGFNEGQQREMLAMMKKLQVGQPPFTQTPDVEKPSRFRPHPPKAKVFWTKPQLVCEVSYTEITSDGVMRHPSFEGMRTDKKAKDVTRETAIPVNKALRKTPERKGYPHPLTDKDRKSLVNPNEETQVKTINGHELKFTHLSKIYWPKEKITKREMINYYYQVAPYILPYLKDRPQSLNRYPNGINGKNFYQKDITGKSPDWIKMEPYHTSDGKDKNFLVPQNEASILYMVNSGAIEMNPWNSTIHNEDNPDWCLIDLDPSEKNTFEQVIEVAQATKQVLDDLGVAGYPKTSGSTGIHIYIPLGGKYNYDQCQLFGKIIATRVHALLPSLTSIERMIKNRDKKLYVDYLQNRPKATLAAPYSLRPKPGATVSMPLHWKEVKTGLKMTDFTIHNAMDRIKKEGDLFKPVLGKGIDLKKLLKRLD